MFFGTVEVAWVKDVDIIDFKEGIHKGYFAKKMPAFRLALEQASLECLRWHHGIEFVVFTKTSAVHLGGFGVSMWGSRN